MSMNLIDFVEKVDDEQVIKAYTELFCEVEGEHSLKEAEDIAESLLHEMRDAMKQRSESPADGDVEHPARFIFSTVITDEHLGENGAPPIVDVSLMRYDSIKDIPSYMSTHPSWVDYAEVSESAEARDIVYEQNKISFPLLLTPLDELMSYDVYIPDDNEEYACATAAGLMYALACLGDTIEECEARKRSLASEVIQIAADNGFSYDNADELMSAVTPPINPDDFDDDEFLGKTITARYNARIGLYDRIYCDASIQSDVL